MQHRTRRTAALFAATSLAAAAIAIACEDPGLTDVPQYGDDESDAATPTKGDGGKTTSSEPAGQLLRVDWRAKSSTPSLKLRV